MKKDQTSTTKTNEGTDQLLVSRNIHVDGRRTSLKLDPLCWMALQEIKERESASLEEICNTAKAWSPCKTSLASALRLFILDYFMAAATDEGHALARHGQLVKKSYLSLRRPSTYGKRKPARRASKKQT